MKKLLLILPIAFLILTGCAPSTTETTTNKPKAEMALENQGYKEIQLGTNVLFGCSKDDSMLTSYEFTAKDGERTVKGVVCCGLIIKGCTIRY